MVRRHETLDGWVIGDAATALTVLRDPATWSSDRFDGPRPAEYAAWEAELKATEEGVRELLEVTPQALIGLDPPLHTRMRDVLRRSFAPAAVEALRPVVEREVAAALPRVLTGEPVDVVEAFTRPVPFRVVARLLALPREDEAELEALAHAASTDDTAAEDFAAFRARMLAERDIARFFGARVGAGGDGAREAAGGGDARVGAGGDGAPQIAAGEGAPQVAAGEGAPQVAGGDDAGILPVLRAAVADGTISPREAAGLCREVLVAGSDSVGHLLAGALHELATAGTPDDLSAFIEHRLALDPPFASFWRRATRDTELAGASIPAGGLVQLPYGALNRTAARHLSFGHGIHFCLGAALARLEAHVALTAILPAKLELIAAERLASPSVNGYRRLVLRASVCAR